MDRAPAYEADGCRFDPGLGHHLVAVAQWTGQQLPKLKVARSSRAGDAQEGTRR